MTVSITFTIARPAKYSRERFSPHTQGLATLGRKPAARTRLSSGREMSSMFADYAVIELMPLPPPFYSYVSSNGQIVFVNGTTREESAVHPLHRALEEYYSATNSASGGDCDSSNANNESKNDKSNDNKTIDKTRQYDDNVNNSNNDEHKEVSIVTSIPMYENVNTMQSSGNIEISISKSSVNKSNAVFADFRCDWKEKSLFDEISKDVYGLVIRFFVEDGHTLVKFDGEGVWREHIIEGHYGPVERCDLFMDSKVKVFGRTLTITSTAASICHWIHDEGVRLKKRQDWLQQKVESVGAVPVVRRLPPIAVKGSRPIKSEGQTNLRRLHVENVKLSEQLIRLGLGHFLKNNPPSIAAGSKHVEAFLQTASLSESLYNV